MNLIYVAAGGALGTLARYYVTGRVPTWNGRADLGVFVVNIIGSFLIGLFLTLGEERFVWTPQLRLLVVVGFLGGFTTFSTLAWNTFEMLQLRDVAALSLNIAGSMIVGLFAVYLGSLLARTV